MQKSKVRYYSFGASKKLPVERMTEIEGIRIPSIPGSSYHAILCALATNRDRFTYWDRIYSLTERYMIQYGGPAAWSKFSGKKNVKTYKDRIKDSTHTLTRSGKNCYGYRLHEMGMGIYFFKDGAMLLTGGRFFRKGNRYDVDFGDRKLQVRYRGMSMTYREYRAFVELGYIDGSGKILDHEAIQNFRIEGLYAEENDLSVKIQVTLSVEFSQEMAYRLEQAGMIVCEVQENQISGAISRKKLAAINKNPYVAKVKIFDA